MKVCRVEARRFLCFKDVRVDLDDELQLIAGPNNAGKSSLIRLIEAFFSNPTGDSLATMFPLHSYYSELGARTLSTIQLWFRDFTNEEREVFGSVIRRDGRMAISLRCSRSGTLSYQASKKASAEESQRLYLEVLDRFNFVKIPSIRVGGSETENEPGSIERLMETLETILIRSGSTRSTSLQAEFATKIEEVEGLVREVLDESASAIKTDLPFLEGDVRFQLPEPRFALRGMLSAAVIESLGDVNVPVASRGTGFQSALVLGILRYVASREAQADGNVFFAIEEPEAFLHPQTQRALAKIIRGIAEDAQVLVTTHSSVLVDSFDITRIARLPLTAGGTEHDWSAPDLEATDEGRLSRYCSAANSELVFANAVIFVEGEGDHAVVEKLLGRACDSAGGHYAVGVTVIEASGLGKIKYLIQLSELFGVEAYVLADIDGVKKLSGSRVLMTVLGEKGESPSREVRDSIADEADQESSDFKEALARQKALNDMLEPFNAFVLSSDLEGVLLDSFGFENLADALGPEGEAAIDDAFVRRLKTEGTGYEDLASWMGSKGWNSNRSTSKKLEPHLPPVLIDRWFSANDEPSDALAPLVVWLEEILAEATPTPI